MTHPSWELKNLKRRVTIARHFPHNTCPASRHVQMMGELLPKKGGYPMLQEEPEHCAQSILAVVAALYEARTELARFRGDPWYAAMQKAKKRAQRRRSRGVSCAAKINGATRKVDGGTNHG